MISVWLWMKACETARCSRVALSLEGLKDLIFNRPQHSSGRKQSSFSTHRTSPEQPASMAKHGTMASLFAGPSNSPGRIALPAKPPEPRAVPSSPRPPKTSRVPPGWSRAFSQTEMFAMVLRTSFVSTVAMQFIGAEMADFWTTKIHGNPLSSTSARALVALPASGYMRQIKRIS